MDDDDMVIHVAAPPIAILGEGSPRFIQRCMICGAKICDSEDGIGADPEDFGLKNPKKTKGKTHVIAFGPGVMVQVLNGKHTVLDAMPHQHTVAGVVWTVPSDYPKGLCVDLVEKAFK